MSARRAGARRNPASEDAFDAEVLGVFNRFEWLSYHTHDSRRSAAGFPDRTFVKGPRLVFAELKAKSAEEARKSAGARTTRAQVDARPEWLRYFDVTDAQARWLEALREVYHGVAEAHFDATGGEWPPSDRPVGVEVYLWRPSDLEDIVRVAGHGASAYALEDALAWARSRRASIVNTTIGGPTP